MNYEIDTQTVERERESKKAYHKKRFIIYLVLWICSGIITGIAGALGALAGAGLGGESGAISGALIFMLIGAIASVTFLVLWIYHLVKWVSKD